MPAPTHPLPPHAAVDPAIARGIRQASAATNVDFGFLVAEASQESGLNPEAKAANGSASGLFQFVHGTWLQLVQRFGAKYGIGELAQQVTLDPSGRARVSDPALRQQILDLRGDPRLSAAFAAEYAKANAADLEHALGRSVNRADLYMAHFLGAGGASRFLQAVGNHGNAIAAELLPEAAAANKPVFYDSSTGAPKTVAEIYRTFAAKIEQHSHALDGEAGEATASAPAPANPTAGKPKLAAALGRLALGAGTSVAMRPFRIMLDALAVSALKLVRGSAASPQSRHRNSQDI